MTRFPPVLPRLLPFLSVSLIAAALLGTAGVAAGTYLAHAPALTTSPNATPGPRIAVVIDDIGYDLNAGRRAIQLPGSVTIAVLPHTPNGRTLAREAHALGREILLHQPMENTRALALGPGGLRPDMDRAQLLSTLRGALDEIPWSVGISNHTGSLLTAQEQPMQWVLDELRNRNLFFLDNRTTAGTVVPVVGSRMGVEVLSRDVFLDHHIDPQAIRAEFGRLLSRARRHGEAILVAHPYRESLEFLELALPAAERAGYELVPVSALLPRRGIRPAPVLATGAAQLPRLSSSR